nr:MAG TPA: Guanylate kinase [Caudoviricetes sp.]
MDRLILLVGPSGSGKTTVAYELYKEGYNVIQSYTTRKQRHEGEWGHIFMKLGSEWGEAIVERTLVGFENMYPVKDKNYKYIDIDDMIAFKELYGDYYFATKEQYQGKGTSIYVVDPSGAEQVRNGVKDAEIITIFLMADKFTRQERIYIRDIKNNKTSQETLRDMKKRITKDREIFSKCKCDYVVDANRELKDVVSDIKEIISNL